MTPFIAKAFVTAVVCAFGLILLVGHRKSRGSAKKEKID